MSAPADRPAATPRLTEESLAAIERAYAEYADPFNPYIRADDVVDHLPTLLAEVRRQRAVLADLARYDAEIFRLVGHEAELPQEQPEEPRRFGLFDLLEPRTGPPAPREPDPPIGTWITCPSCGGTGDNNLQRDGHGDGYRCTTCDGGAVGRSGRSAPATR